MARVNRSTERSKVAGRYAGGAIVDSVGAWETLASGDFATTTVDEIPEGRPFVELFLTETSGANPAYLELRPRVPADAVAASSWIIPAGSSRGIVVYFDTASGLQQIAVHGQARVEAYFG